jgi:hypothetical protein
MASQTSERQLVALDLQHLERCIDRQMIFHGMQIM